MLRLPVDLLKDLDNFIKTNNRFEYIRRWLHRCGLEGKKIETHGYRHLLVRFNRPYDPIKPTKTLVAHYDRVPSTPGANDNSAAVFQLLCHAGRLALSEDHGNVQILFTDGEELIKGPISSQGAYQLALLFKNFGIKNCHFYIFDMCGIGDTITVGGASSIVLEQAVREGRIAEQFYTEFNQELDYAMALTERFQGPLDNKIYTLFSDDLGFLLNGYPAVYFSTLPEKEVTDAAVNWREVFYNQHTQRILRRGYLSQEFQEIIRPLLPNSWQTMHTIHDTIDRLELSAFLVMEEFLNFITYEE